MTKRGHFNIQYLWLLFWRNQPLFCKFLLSWFAKLLTHQVAHTKASMKSKIYLMDITKCRRISHPWSKQGEKNTQFALSVFSQFFTLSVKGAEPYNVPRRTCSSWTHGRWCAHCNVSFFFHKTLLNYHKWHFYGMLYIFVVAHITAFCNEKTYCMQCFFSSHTTATLRCEQCHRKQGNFPCLWDEAVLEIAASPAPSHLVRSVPVSSFLFLPACTLLTGKESASGSNFLPDRNALPSQKRLKLNSRHS